MRIIFLRVFNQCVSVFENQVSRSLVTLNKESLRYVFGCPRCNRRTHEMARVWPRVRLALVGGLVAVWIGHGLVVLR